VLSIIRIAALTLALSSPAAMAQQARNLEYGTYACVVQRLVGHQTSESDKVRRSGPLRPPTDRFLVTIEKIERKPETCEPPSPYTKPRTYGWWWECDASNQAVLSRDKAIGPFRSDGMNIFLSPIEGISSFWFRINGTYRLVFDNLDGDHYLEEGVCQRMK
jgi:hypothetical protein